jgi:hypothetical protein
MNVLRCGLHRQTGERDIRATGLNRKTSRLCRSQVDRCRALRPCTQLSLDHPQERQACRGADARARRRSVAPAGTCATWRTARETRRHSEFDVRSLCRLLATLGAQLSQPRPVTAMAVANSSQSSSVRSSTGVATADSIASSAGVASPFIGLLRCRTSPSSERCRRGRASPAR